MKILIAYDEAFNFTYRANIDALAAIGDVAYFSPLHDALLPSCDMLYLPGGYPELYADGLSANAAMRDCIKEYAGAGGMIFAECGGFMYLCRSIDNVEMCGVLLIEATMVRPHLHLGYRQMGVGGNILRGHEFHYSSIKPLRDIPDGLKVVRRQCSAAGRPVDTPVYIYKNVMAGYTHWYWAETGFDIVLRVMNYES